MARYERHDYEGYTFVFKYDDEYPSMLHIWIRHRKTVYDAMEIWFEGDDLPFDSEHERYETVADKQALYWFWLEEDQVVMIISCFDR